MTYFLVVKNALDYPMKRMLVKQGDGISLLWRRCEITETTGTRLIIQ